MPFERTVAPIFPASRNTLREFRSFHGSCQGLTGGRGLWQVSRSKKQGQGTVSDALSSMIRLTFLAQTGSCIVFLILYDILSCRPGRYPAAFRCFSTSARISAVSGFRIFAAI